VNNKADEWLRSELDVLAVTVLWSAAFYIRILPYIKTNTMYTAHSMHTSK